MDLTPDSVTDSDRINAQTSSPSLRQSILTGAIGFSLTSFIVFATVAFAQIWMYQHVGVTGAYLVWIALFILLGGGALSPVVKGNRSLMSFYAVFGAAFLLYGVAWMAAYFTLKLGAGEWLGSLAGSVAMALVIAAAFRVTRKALLFSAVLFVSNSAGYFLGSIIYYTWGRPAGLALWGAVWGACLGAGLGAVLHLAQSKQAGATSTQ